MTQPWEYTRQIPTAIWLAASWAAFRVFRHVPLSLKLLTIYTFSAFVVEVVAYILAKTIQNNLALYNTFSFVETTLLCGYFNESVPALRRRHLGWVIASVSILIGISIAIWLQPFSVLGTYYFVWEMIVVIILSLFSLASMITREMKTELWSNVHFWICISLVFYWSLMFATVSIEGYLGHIDIVPPSILRFTNQIINSITAGLIAYVFIRFGKRTLIVVE